MKIKERTSFMKTMNKMLPKGKKCLLWVLMCIFIPMTRTNATEYQYDNLGRVTVVTYEDGTTIEYQYDSNGNITNQQTDKIEIPKETPPGTDIGTSKEPVISQEPDSPAEEPDEELGFWEEVANVVENIIDTIKEFISGFFKSLFG